jgi:hypothetical protein
MQVMKRQRDPLQLAMRIQVDAVAMQKLWQWTEIARGEVSALGLVEEIRDADTGLITSLLVTDFMLCKQSCTMDETVMDAASIAELITGLEAKGIDSRKLRCWAHSHGGMSVFWSGTDDDCIAGLANGEYLLSLVVNRKHDSMMRLDQFSPCHLYVNDVVWEIYYPHVDGLAERCLEEFRSKVQEGGMLSGNGRVSTVIPVQDLRDAHARGAISDQELLDELDWLGIERGEFDEQPPF